MANLSADERAALMEELRTAMNEAAKDLDFKRLLACETVCMSSSDGTIEQTKQGRPS